MAKALSKQYTVTVWWAAPVEVSSAFARLKRTGHLTSAGQVQAQVTLRSIRGDWKEVQPSEELRDHAERLVDRFPLKAADALQLAAAMAWCSAHPSGRAFLSGDRQLLDAARQLGFETVEA
jgi:predicted nucleic acid-binding protein